MHDEEPTGLRHVNTRESDDEDDAQGHSTFIPEATADPASDWGHNGLHGDEEEDEELEEGMLARDLPKRTTFYDPVAERQMSQMDAKLFYQRSKLDLRSGGGTWTQTTPAESPILFSGSQPGTEYGADSLVLDDSKPGEGPGLSSRPASVESMSGLHMASRGSETIAGQSQASGLKAAQASAEAKAAHAASMGLAGSSLFDTEPEITAELSAISKNIQKILDTRRRYISVSSQGPDDNPRDHPHWDIYPPPPEPAWRQDFGDDSAGATPGQGGLGDIPEQSEQQRRPRRRKPGQAVGEDFNMDDLLPLPGDDGWEFKIDEDGVFQVFENEESKQPVVDVPTIREYYMNLDEILTISSDGPSKSFAFRRLQYLEAKFNLYALLNEYQETADSKKVPHRDFYNVRKVDTHVHHSACMNQKHLLRFIKSKMKKHPNEVVLFRDGKHLTLAEVFASINLTAYDLSIDTLDMHVSSSNGYGNM